MILIGLIYNLSILVTLSVLSGFLDLKYRIDTLIGKILQGLLFGAVAVIGMLYPFILSEGIIFDGRSIIVSLCALFFGPLSGVLAALITIIGRILIGGVGTLTGILVILASFIIGTIFHILRNKGVFQLNNKSLYFIGLIVTLIFLAIISTLPSNFIEKIYLTVGLTIIVFYPIITLLIGKVLKEHEDNQKYLVKLIIEKSLYKTTLDNVGDAVISTNEFGDILAVNSEAIGLLNIDEIGVKRKKLNEIIKLIKENNKHEIINPLENVLSKNIRKDIITDLLLVASDNISIPVTCISSSILDDSNKVIGAVLTIRNLSEKRKSEEKLIESEAKFRNLFENHPAVKLLVDPQNGRIIEANQSAVNFYGWPIKKLKTMTLSNLSGLAINDSLAKLLNLNRFEKSSYETTHQKSDGSKVNIKIYSGKINIENKDYLHFIIHDVTDHKLLESELIKRSLAIEYSPVNIIITDLNGQIEYVNPQFIETTGYTFEESVGKSPLGLSSYLSKEKYFENIWGIIFKDKNDSEIIQNKKKNGELFWESIVTSPIKNSSGEITNFLAITEDITERIEQENELKKYREELESLVEIRTVELNKLNSKLIDQLEKQKQLEIKLNSSLKNEKELNELKTKFVATVSHEFITPLSAILSSIQMIKKYSFNWAEEQKEIHYNRISSTISNLTKLIDDVLFISKIESSKIAVNYEKLSLSETIKKIEEDLAHLLRNNKSLTIINNCNKDEIITDKKLFVQIILNLITNSIKFSPYGGNIELNLSLEKSKLKLVVKDVGIGIPEKELKHVFEAFYRSENTVGINGSGLGLHIVKKAVKTLNGNVSIKSEVNLGTEVAINLPINENGIK